MTKPGQDPGYHFETQKIPGHDTICVEDLEHKPGARTVSVEAGKLKPGVRYLFMGRVGWGLNTGSSLATSPIARDHAALVVRSLIMAPGPEDWRGWVLHVADADGEEIFTLPFAALLGKPH